MSPDALQGILQNPARAGMQQRYEVFTCARDYLDSFKGSFSLKNHLHRADKTSHCKGFLRESPDNPSTLAFKLVLRQ